MNYYLFVLLLAGTAAFLWAAWIEPRLYQINRYDVSLHKPLGRSYRVLHLTDIHFAKKDGKLGGFFDRLAKESYDFVFVTGDVIDCEEGITSCVENLKKFSPALGTYVVFGNHDYFDYHLWDVISNSSPSNGRLKYKNRPDLFEKALEKEGIRVMRNETEEIKSGRDSLLIHGLDDPVTGRANIRKAMQDFDPAKVNILLTHTVDVFLDIGEGEIDLSFSGHSHGGQICMPLLGPVVIHTVFGRHYAAGIRRLRGAVCSISRGVGASRFFFLRFLAPPEAIVLNVHGTHH